MSDAGPTELAIVPPVDPDRLDAVLTLILTGATERQILAVVDKKWPGEDAQPLILAAMRSLVETGAADPLAIHGFCIEAARAIYRKAIAADDLDVALKAVTHLHRMAIGK